MKNTNMKGLSEEAFFFDGDDVQLFGFMHFPTSKDKNHGFLFCHPFIEEKLWSHRAMVSLARDLAARGYSVMRFDCRGYGDSEGDFSQSTLSTAIRDIGAAAKEMERRIPSLTQKSILGLRLGASLAVSVLAKDSTFSSAVLWEPIVDGKRYLDNLLRGHLTTQLAAWGKIDRNREELLQDILCDKAVVVEGYSLKKELVNELISLKLNLSRLPHDMPYLVGQVLRSEAQKPDDQLVALVPEGTLGSFLTAVEPKFWQETKQFCSKAKHLSGETIQWLENSDG